MPDRAALLPLAESIADGSAVDWDAAEARATGDDRAVIRQLRILANLAGLHRSLAVDPNATIPPAVAHRSTTSPAIGSWAHLALIERIGGGTFGDVYRAWDRHLEREVALKLLRVDESTGDPHGSRIATEGRLLARVRHPNVITVHGVAVQDHRVGLWMDLVRGATLEELLLKRGPFGASEAALIGIDLCRALAAIHAAGLIHRDVKAQNVMREDGGRIMLMDLGTGREIQPGGRQLLPDLAGTPLYLPPEIFDGASASERSDLYSLGVLLYHLVTASFPVRATTIEELKSGHAKGTAVRLRDARADLPTAFVRVVDRAIAADPGHRYESAGALEADLANARDDAVPASSVRIAGEQTRTSWFTGRRTAAILAAVAALLVVAALAWPVLRGRPAPVMTAGAINRIAVLPLENLSGDPSQDYFAAGMTDEFIDALGRLGSVNVISRTSVLGFKHPTARLPEIARALKVDALLEGSVVLSPGGGARPAVPDRVRVNVRLVLAGTDTPVWTRRFESDLTDILKLQADVAKSVADEIKIVVRPQEQRRLDAAAQVNAEAYKAYLLGRERWNRRDPAELRKGLEYFQQAVRLDPTYARAYAGLADSYALLAGDFGQLSPIQGALEATTAATKALQLDASLAEAHTSLAFVKFFLQWDWAGARQEFERALVLNPSYAVAHQWYGDYLSAIGLENEAIEQMKRALELDPLSLIISRDVAWPMFFARRYDDAIAQLQDTLSRDPNYAPALSLLGRAHIENGQFAQGLAALKRVAAATGIYRYQGQLAQAYARAGQRAEARKLLNEITHPAPGRFIPPYDIALVHSALGQRDQTIEWLERAYREHDSTLVNVRQDPRFGSLQTDPRFKALLERMGFPR